MTYINFMKELPTRLILTAIAITSPLILSCLITSCGNGVPENHHNRGLTPGVGPFDNNGNYVESWADDPRKGVAWRSDRIIDDENKKKKLAKSQQPKRPTPSSHVAYHPPVVVNHLTPQSRPHTPRSVQNTTYHRPTPPVSGITTPRSKPRSTPRSHTTSHSTKKKAVLVKPKHRSPIHYTIKKGDTLYGLSRRFKVSVSNIKKANGMKGTTLRTGRTLLIPRH